MKATIYVGDVIDRLREMPDESVQCVVTSPPYWGLRDYGMSGQIGLEPTPQDFIAKMTEVFREVRRVLRSDGTCWVNMGDSYYSQPNQRVQQPGGRSDVAGYKQATNNGSLTQGSSYVEGRKPKDLIGMPWRLAFALQDDGWWLRQDIIWSKPNPMPESVTDRCTKAHEYIFLLTKSARYYYNQEAILEPCSPNTTARLSQNVEAQIGSERAHAGGKTNGTMKAVGRLPDKYKGSLLGRSDGPGQDRRGTGERGLGAKGEAADSAEVRSGKGSAFGRGAGWRDDPNTTPDTRNKRSVWSIATEGYSEAHFATFPTKLVEPCILAGSKPGDVVLDPFCGSGTTGLVSLRYHRDFVGIELNPDYARMAERRIGGEIPLFAGVEVVGLKPVLAEIQIA